MARVVKKVKKNKLKLGKKFYIILTSVLVALAAVGIGLGIYFYIKNNTEEDTIDFTDYTEYKINYSDIEDVLNGSTQHIFIFAYDGKSFDIEENDDDNLIYKRVVSLIRAINKTNESGKIIEFRLIDTSLSGNSSALSDSKLGALADAPALIYIYGDTYSSVTKNTTVEETISGSGKAKIRTYIADAIEYIQNLTE